jgi:hypothetical protein
MHVTRQGRYSIPSNSASISVSLYLCMSVSLYLSISLSLYLSISLSLYLSISVYLCPFIQWIRNYLSMRKTNSAAEPEPEPLKNAALAPQLWDKSLYNSPLQSKWIYTIVHFYWCIFFEDFHPQCMIVRVQVYYTEDRLLFLFAYIINIITTVLVTKWVYSVSTKIVFTM